MEKLKRTESISIRLTKEEMAEIADASSRDFDFPSSWVRKKILGLIRDETTD